MTSNTLKFFVFITVVFFSLFANAEGVKLKENTFTVNTTLSLILDVTLKGNCQDWDAATKITIYDANGDVYDKLDLIDVKNDTVNEILENICKFSSNSPCEQAKNIVLKLIFF